MMVSYAQNYEDVRLARVFPHTNGFYVDVGANDPVNCSLTKHFYDAGWHGVNIEPAADAFARLQPQRPRDVNLNVGLSDHDGTLTFFEGSSLTGLSTFSAVEAEVHRKAGLVFEERTVQVTTLARVCERYVTGTIDFMSVDVEGYERQVLEGGDWRRWRPRVVVVEATRPNTAIPSHKAWEPVLLERDYLLAVFDGINRFYVRAEDRVLAEQLREQVSLWDDFAPYAVVRESEERAKALADKRELERRLAILEARVREFDGIGPLAIKIGRKLSRLSQRLPGLSSAIKKVVRRRV